MSTRNLRTAVLAGVVAVATALTAACGVDPYAKTELPKKASSPTTSTTPAPPPACANPLQTYDPLPDLPALADFTDARVRSRLQAKGRLTVGVSADTLLLGARNPLTGQIEGFDIDIAREVARSIFGSPTKVQLRVITAAERIPLLKEGEIDMVARNMTINCARWADIAFSAEYYHSGQKVLVAKDIDSGVAPSTTLEDLGREGKRVCAPTGSTSLEKLRSISGAKVVTAGNHTGCLVLFQQGRVDAITGDDTVLAGLAKQDPYTVVSKARAITAEPYGLGFNKDDVYLARYVNRVLADMTADGRWKAIYDKWLAAPLGPAPAPPAPVYGR